MPEGSPSFSRIEAALARIEVASAAAARREADLARRHAALRTTIADALGALDALIAAEDAG